jgi:hypothetical protein
MDPHWFVCICRVRLEDKPIGRVMRDDGKGVRWGVEVIEAGG